MVRFFIAVPLPEDITAKIEDLAAEIGSFRGLPQDIRFAPKENWHFTTTFLGYEPEETIPVIIKVLNDIGFPGPIPIRFEKLTYGPLNRTPRLIWLTVDRETSLNLGTIKNTIEDELIKNNVRWPRDSRPVGHLTLARFKEIPLRTLPKIERDLDLSYSATEIRLMRSTLKRTGAEYETLSSVVL